MSSTEIAFLDFIRVGIGTSRGARVLRNIDWSLLKALADRHGLAALVLDGLNSLPLNSLNAYGMPQMLRLEWIGDVLQNYEGRYADYRKRIGELAGFYNQHGFKLMVLKGYGLSLNWPNPKHRPCGDIDIYAFGDYKAADEALHKELGIKIEKGHHHHTVFEWKGYSVENHYDFVNVHYGHRNEELEKIFKELADETNVNDNLNDNNGSTSKGTEITSVLVDGERVYLPSPNLHALFLLRHCMQDFASAEMNLRQVLDWAFFIEKHTSEIDWNWLTETIRKFNMADFFNVLNAICVGDLGFDVKIFPTVQFEPFMKKMVLDEIISPSFPREEPRNLIPRLVFKYKRWKGNAWKQELCYHDSRVASFFTGVWNHLLKPKTI